MTHELHLKHDELYQGKQFNGTPGISPTLFFLDFNKIPIHPAVLDSDFAYTTDFFDEVFYSIPDSIETDIEAANRYLNGFGDYLRDEYQPLTSDKFSWIFSDL